MAVNPSPRLVIVDDTDNNIKYNSGQDWVQDHGSLDQTGTNGPTYLHTSHGTQSNTSLTFTFNGTNVYVYGTLSLVLDVSGPVYPSWECSVDGIVTSPLYNGSGIFDGNNLLLCQLPTAIPDGEHQLTVNITTTAGRTFWIDDIRYIPSTNASLDTASILVQNSDPAISFSGEWQIDSDFGNMTQQAGATMQFSFIGKSISWYSSAWINQAGSGVSVPSFATYAIDGGPPQAVQFLFSGGPPDSGNSILPNQVLFTTPDLHVTPGPHTLLVTNQGIGLTTPLTLDYLIITSASAPTSTSSGSKAPIGEIIGAVVGGLIFFTALTASLFFWRRKKRHLANQAAYNAQQPHPFNLDDVPHHDASPLQTTQIHPHTNISGQVRKQPGIGAGHSGVPLATSTTPTFPTQSPSPPQNVSSNDNGNNNTASRILVHVDNGMRIPSAGAESIGDLPPHYTEM